MADVGTTYVLDTKAAEDALDALGHKDDLLRAGAKQTGEALTNAFSQAAAAGQKHLTQLDAILAETRQSGAATQQFASEVAGLVKEIRDVAAAQDASRRAAAASADERRKATAAAKEAAKAEKKAAEEAAAAAEKNKGVVDKLFDKLSTKAPAGGFFGSALTGAIAATGGFLAFNAIVDRVKQGLTDFAAITGVQATLKALTGSAADGGREFAYIKGQAQSLGLELIPTAKAYTGLFAAAKEANIPVAQTRAIFEGVTGAAKVLNLTADDTNGVLLALQQIASKGTVASEELRGQIGERLPGAFGLAAKAMGLTTAELGKQLQAGKVLSADFLPKFAAQLKATYGNATADAAQQVGSNLGRINTYFAESSARLGATFAPAIAAFADFVSASKTTAQVAADSSAAYFKQRDSIKSLVPQVGGLLANYESLNAISGRSIGQQIELDKTIQALAKSVPGAVTEFDKYGKALSINGDAVRDFIKDQQNLTAYLNRTALKDNSADLRRLLAEQAKYQQQVALLNQTQQETGQRVLPKGATQGGQILYYTKEETAKIIATAGEQLTQIQKDIDANLENRQRLRGKSPLLPTLDSPEDKKAIQGLIEKQEQLIKDLKERQKKAVNENKNDGSDFLFGKGGLNKQLEDAQKELDRLQGKIDKSAKAAADRLAAALKALEAQRASLMEKAAAAVTKEADDAAQRALLTFQTALRQASIIEQQLREREAAVRKAGGRGNNADGVIDGTQAAQLAALRVAALDAYYTALYQITQAREQRLFDLREVTDTKEVEAINRKYDKLLQAAKDAQEREAIELARQRDQLALKAEQEQQRISRTATLATSNAQAVGQVFGAGTGVSVFEAKRAEKQALLDIEKQAAEDSLNNTLNKTNKEGEIERAALRAQLARIAQQQKDLDRERQRSEFSLYKLVLGGKDSPELRTALDDFTNNVLNSLSQIEQANQQAAATKAATATQNINELQSQLNTEVQLNREGSASNIKALQDQLVEQKRVRKEALADQRKAAQQQVIIDALTQASSVTTAAAEALANLSGLGPYGWIAGLAAAGLIVGGFVTAKTKAYQAASQIGQGGSFFKGGYTGDGNPHDTSQALGAKPYEYHKGEYVMPHEVTRDLRHALLEPIHKGQPERIDWNHPNVRALLPDLSLPATMRAERAAAQRLDVQHSFAPMRAEFDGMRAELREIKETNAQMASEKKYLPTPDGYIETDPVTNRVKRVKFE